MSLRFSDHPGRRERHLQRRHGNPLFADPPPQVSEKELERSRGEDLEEAQKFQGDFVALIQEAVDLKPSEESEVILKLKERVDQAYEQASGLAGDQAPVKAAIPQLITAIMGAVRRGATAARFESLCVYRRQHDGIRGRGRGSGARRRCPQYRRMGAS